MVGREQDDGNARFALVATVTDTAGQKYSQASVAHRSRPIRSGWRVLPESGHAGAGVAQHGLRVGQLSPTASRPRFSLLVQGQSQELPTNKLGVASFELTPRRDR